MKTLYALVSFTLIVGAVMAQTTEGSVTTGAGYENQIWYSMENGEVGAAPLNNWDLAFEITGFTASIRANTQKGLVVYQAPFPISNWNELDTAGMANNWPELYNDNKNWERGAFNLYPTSEFDLGWGVYNIITHTVAGDSLYVLEFPDGEFKKLRFDALAGGVYNFTYANLDGSEEVTAQVDKDDYTGKNFGYYSIETGEAIDREPLSAEWDITFLKYTEDLNGFAYPVSGVFHNYDVRTADVSGDLDPWEVGFSSDIDGIGYDWKSFDFSSGWQLDENRTFYVEALNGNIYELIFTGFEGSSTGVYEFGIAPFSALRTVNPAEAEFKLFPNPARGEEITIQGEFSQNDRIEIYTATGSLVKDLRVQNLNTLRFSSADFEAGTYLIRIVSQNQAITKKLIISR